MNVGKTIQSLREEKNMTQKELADKINISYSVMNRIESGERPARDEEIKKIAKALDVSSDYLLGITGAKDSSDEKSKLPLEFNTPEEAIEFILKQNAIMGFGGFDINELSDEEVVEFANSLLEHLKLLSLKYKK
jgi:transcriptional regulator with XRE-family HTH domain|nr:MAG TPA: helix-turn-helix domain protein [Caudoviricetes sp.]